MVKYMTIVYGSFRYLLNTSIVIASVVVVAYYSHRLYNKQYQFPVTTSRQLLVIRNFEVERWL